MWWRGDGWLFRDTATEKARNQRKPATWFRERTEVFPYAAGELPASAKIVSNLTAPLDLIVLFVDREANLARQFPTLAEKLSTTGMMWVAWPKKSSGVTTDLAFENVQRIGLDCGLVDVKICAIDEVWSGLKFVYRVKDRKRIEQSRRH